VIHYFFVPLYFERLTGYKKTFKLEPMILRLITVITGLCYSRKSCNLSRRLNMKGSRSKGIKKACSFFKDSQEQEDIFLPGKYTGVVRVEAFLKLR
jgi:hypothetical protein